MKKKRKIILLCTLLISLTITACSIGGKKLYFSTGLSDTEVFKIGGSPFELSEAMLYLTTEKNLYEQSFGEEIWDKDIGGVTLQDYVKDYVKKQLADIKIMNLLAEEKNIELSDDELQSVKQDASNYFNALTDYEKKYMKVDLKTVEQAYKEYKLADKVYEELTKNINPEISDSDAKVIKVASIYAKTYTLDKNGKRVEYTESEKEKSRKDIQSLLDQINNGSDFLSVGQSNTDADQVEYQFGRGEMIQEFEEAAYQLKSGEISQVIDTADGYYIIKCISDYLPDETQTHKKEMISDEKKKAFKKIYDPFIKNKSSEFNTKLWKKISFDEMKKVKVSNFYQNISSSKSSTVK